MNKKIGLVLFASCLIFSAQAQAVFTLEDVIYRAQTQSPIFKLTETTRETRYWQYRTYKTAYNPQMQIQDNGGLLYTHSISPVTQPDGTVSYIPLNQINPGVNLALQQPIQWTGGQISVNSSANFFKNYSGAVSQQWSGVPVNIALYQPLLAFNPLKWNKIIEPIRYEESKRDYAENMESISHDAAVNFFNVLTAQINIQIAQFNLAYNDTIYKIEQGRYNIGTTSEDKLLQVELQLLRSRQDVAKAKLDLQTFMLTLRTYIGLRNGEPFSLALPDSIPYMRLDEDEAIAHAKQTRSAYIAFERRKTEAARDVALVRGSLYQVGLRGAYGLNNQSPSLDGIYRSPQKQQYGNVTFNVPILDWGRRRAAMHTARANQKLAEYQIAQDEVTFEQTILTQVRQFEVLYLQLEISKKSDEVALKRYIVAQNRYLTGKVDITNLNIALTEKDAAKRDYVQSLNRFWSAYYDLRRLTLYDWVNRKYLYDPNMVD